MIHEGQAPRLNVRLHAAHRLRLRPPTATPAAMAALVQVQFLAGAALALLVSVLPGQEPALTATLEAGALAALGLAVVVHCRARVSPLGLHIILALGSSIVTVAAATAVDSSTAVAFTFCYSGMVVVAVASASWCGVALHVSIALGALIWLHADRDIGHPTTAVLVGFVTVLLAVITTRTLRATVHTQVDALTRLLNRRGFEEHLSDVVTNTDADARSDGQAAAITPLLCVLDIDHFGQLNRTGGQGGGDAALRSVADALRTVAPVGAVTARLGGDQFALLLTQADTGAGLTLASVLQQAIAPLQASIGLAQAEPEQDGGVLLPRAESALREAKAAGRNCVRVAEPQDEVLLRNLCSTVANATLTVALQPLVDPTCRKVVGVEALARWHHPSRGWVSPATFIPLAEKNGLIPELGLVVLERACREASTLVEDLGHPVKLTVNAAGGELVRPEYVSRVIDVLHRTQWPAGDLVIEVTESSMDAASAATLATLEELRDVGVGIAIDDFGTGYSAFSQLDAIPADYLKLDSSFIAATTTSSRRRAMLSALVTLCHDLGLKVIAEGVETDEQAQLVADRGCDLAQGYLYARPMLVADLIAALAAVRTAANATEPTTASSTSHPDHMNHSSHQPIMREVIWVAK